MESTFLFQPTPHEEAIAFIRNKPVVSREVFDRLLPELKARAFTITGLEGANAAQAALNVRDRIADLPAGGDWDKIKEDIIGEISPWLVDENAPEDVRAEQERRAESRAEMLLRTHGFQAYQAANYEVLNRQRDVFPAWEYVTAGDDRVRDEHAALNGLIVPADSDFWRDHYPPWDWGCRCRVVGVSNSDLADAKKEDEDRQPEERAVVEGEALRKLNQGDLVLGPAFRRDAPDDLRRLAGTQMDVRSPSARATTKSERDAAFQWNPATLRLPLEALKERYDAETWKAFQNFAQAQSLDDKGTTVWQWLGGSPIFPPEAPPTPPPKEAPDTIEAALARLGLDKKVQWTEDDVRALISELRETAPAKAADVVSEILGDNAKGKFSAKSVTGAVQDFVNFLPGPLAKSLPKFSILLAQSLGNDLEGSYSDTAHVLKISKSAHAKGGMVKVRETIYHELMHWVHLHGPPEYRDAIKALYDQRTAGEPLVNVGYTNPLRKDKWWWNYAGTQYLTRDETNQTVGGLEVPTTHVELLANPAKLANMIKEKPNALIIENLRVILSVFFSK